MKKINIKNWDGMYDSENYPELTNGEAFHISIYYRYHNGIPVNKIDSFHKAYNEAVLNNNNKVKSAIKFIYNWNGFALL